MRVRRGLTLIEVVIAILVFAIGGLGLAASSAALAKQMSASTLRGRAATFAQNRSERLHSSACETLTGGEEHVLGIRSTWEAANAGAATLEQRLERTDAHGLHSDRFLSAASCE